MRPTPEKWTVSFIPVKNCGPNPLGKEILWMLVSRLFIAAAFGASPTVLAVAAVAFRVYLSSIRWFVSSSNKSREAFSSRRSRGSQVEKEKDPKWSKL